MIIAYSLAKQSPYRLSEQEYEDWVHAQDYFNRNKQPETTKQEIDLDNSR
jgi:hypothetical protein